MFHNKYFQRHFHLLIVISAIILSTVLLTGCFEKNNNTENIIDEIDNNSTVISDSGKDEQSGNKDTIEDSTTTEDNGGAVDQFYNAVESGKPIFLYFYTDTCPTCIKLDIIYQKMISDEQYSDIAFIKVKADLKKNAEFVQQYQIRFVPSLFTYNASGDNVWSHIGPLDEEEFRDVLAEIQ